MLIKGLKGLVRPLGYLFSFGALLLHSASWAFLVSLGFPSFALLPLASMSTVISAPPSRSLFAVRTIMGIDFMLRILSYWIPVYI